MKEGFDKEIDSLLRRQARGAAGVRAGFDGPAAPRPEAHLDADEMAAFAEGALPPPARIAAVSHLADCDDCRRVVVALAPAPEVGAESFNESFKKAAAVPASPAAGHAPGWRVWLASLFNPRAMRFAAPVLALALVGVVSYVALRSKDGAPLQAARSTGTQTGVVSERASAPSTATTLNANANVPAEPGMSESPPASAAAVAPPQPSTGRGHGSADAPPAADAAGEQASPAPPPPAPVAVAEGPAELGKAASRPAVTEEAEVAKKAEGRDRSDTKEKTAREAEPADEVASNDLATQQQRRAAQSRVNEVQMPDGSARGQRRSDNNASNVYGGGRGETAAPRASDRAASRAEPARRGRSMQTERRAADAEEDGRGAETRAAAGHRFRREGSAWVDVNYRPSMPSTGVRRGTEAFRALVADLPELGRVAEAIGGEVVVVVRGRAYRIR